MTEFQNLPFDIRPDLTKFLIHLTKNTKREDDYSAFNNLVSILRTGEIWGSEKEKGFIKGPNSATCFMDAPIISLKYVLNEIDCDPNKPRYEPFGILITKKVAYKNGCRPVLYLSNDEIEALSVPREELWRVVRFEVDGDNWISWLHEREWRCKGNFKLPSIILTAFVQHQNYANRLQKMINEAPDSFKCIPKSIIPLSIICEGLPYL